MRLLKLVHMDLHKLYQIPSIRGARHELGVNVVPALTYHLTFVRKQYFFKAAESS